MRTITRSGTIGLSAVTAVAMAAPAFAGPSPTPTSLNLRAGKAVVKAHHKDTFTATLTSKGKPLVAQMLSLQERMAPTTGHKTTWSDVTSPTCDPTGCITDANGKVMFTVIPPIKSSKNTQKDQYRAVFKGTTTGTPTYGKSRSQIVTVTVKRG